MLEGKVGATALFALLLQADEHDGGGGGKGFRVQQLCRVVYVATGSTAVQCSSGVQVARGCCADAGAGGVSWAWRFEESCQTEWSFEGWV